MYSKEGYFGVLSDVIRCPTSCAIFLLWDTVVTVVGGGGELVSYFLCG